MTCTITGTNFTGFASSVKGKGFFQAIAPAANNFLQGDFYYVTKKK